MAWAYVLIAGILEVVWSFSLKASEGFTKLLPSLATVFFMILSFVVLSQGMKSLPLGTAYAVWTGIGAVGAALVGIVVLGESASLMRRLHRRRNRPPEARRALIGRRQKETPAALP